MENTNEKRIVVGQMSDLNCEMTLSKDENKKLDEFESLGGNWRKDTDKLLLVSDEVDKIFDRKPKGLKVRGWSNRDDYYEHVLGISGRTMRRYKAQFAKDSGQCQLTDGDNGGDGEGDNEGDGEETDTSSKQKKPTRAQLEATVKALETTLAVVRKANEGGQTAVEAAKRIEEAEKKAKAAEMEAEERVSAADKIIRKLKEKVAKLEATVAKQKAMIADLRSRKSKKAAQPSCKVEPVESWADKGYPYPAPESQDEAPAAAVKVNLEGEESVVA